MKELTAYTRTASCSRTGSMALTLCRPLTRPSRWARKGPLWALVGVPDNKKGDRVPGPDPAIAGVPNGGTFIYEWNTFGWPTTAGVWHYHDHSICDVDNILLGAIGIIVIHNPDDPDDVIGQDLPGGSVNGHPTQLKCFPFPFDVAVLPHDLNRFQVAHPPGPIPPPLPRPPQGGGQGGDGPHLKAKSAASAEKNPEAGATDEQEPRPAFQIQRGDLIFELSDDLKLIRALCIHHFRTPPQNALYLRRDDTSGTPETTIKVNGTVTWFDNGCSPHTVVSQNLPGFTNWPTPLNNLAVPATGTPPQPFPQVGDLAYICGVHGGDPALKSGMYGIIHVVP